MRDYISWFDWAGRTIQNNSTTTFATADGLSVTVTFTRVSGPSVTPYVMNTWSGAVLWQLYDFTNGTVKPALFSQNTLSQVSFTMSITATRAGVAVPFTLVAADAEGSDHTETTTLTTNGSAWRTIEFFRNSNQTSNPLTGCGTQTAKLSLTYSGAPQTGQNPILATDANGALEVTTVMDRTVGGGMAVAFGIFSPIDRGDLPALFPEAHHGLRFTTTNSCNFNSPFPAIVQDISLRLGSVAGDADGIQTLNDNGAGEDEDALTAFPVYDGSGNYTLTLNLNNTTGAPSYLTGWFDYNRDGRFESNESVSVTVPDGATSTSISWAGLPSVLQPGTVADFGFRFRLTSTAAEARNTGGYAKDGEVEDYLIASDVIVPPVPVQAAFTTPDTVCVNTPVTITNTTTGASSYYWNFCVADISTTPPEGVNLGNPNGLLSTPVFMDYVKVNDNYYGFLVDLQPNRLVRLDFGTSLLNTPSAINLGNFGGIIPPNAEGIQMVSNQGKWYALIVGGSQVASTGPRIVKVDFGADITNTSPVATNWGNIGGLTYPVDLHVFKENNNWFGFTVNAESNAITRFNFGPSFDVPPTGVNLGNIGNLNYPTGIFAINNKGSWHVFITNAGGGGSSSPNSSITRLDFGNSLLNTPTGVNLGSLNGTLSSPRDLYILNFCDQMIGFVSNFSATNDIVRLSFNNDLTAKPAATSLGNIGSLNFPHSISRLFRVGPDLYGFITNAYNNTLTRLRFTGCTSSNIPNSAKKDPEPVIYNTPGTYNINLTVDDGLPTQTSFCKQVVVLPEPEKSAIKNIFICLGESGRIGSPVRSATYSWSTGATTDSITVNTPGTYWVESVRYGCSVRDSFIVSYKDGPEIDFGFRQDICDPKAVQFFSSLNVVPSLQSIQWDFGNGKTSTSQSAATVYADYGSFAVQLKAQYADGCISTTTKTIPIDAAFDQTLLSNNDTTICLGDSILLRKKSNMLDYCWRASTDGSPILLDSFVQPTVATTYVLIAEEVGENLVENGDFSQGNSGFSSDFTYAFPNSAEGQYWVGNDPVSWNSNLSSCADHTSGKGAMMNVNGSSAANTTIWSQTLPVTPHTNYSFSAWIQSLSGTNPARLQLSINNIKLGYGISVDPVACQWNRYASGWNSGTATSATISIVNDNTNGGGNDFAIDDLFFGPVTLKTDSFKVLVRGLCDSTSISGVSKVCSPTDTVTYSIYKAVNCTQLYSLVVDPDYADIVEQTPTSLKLVFKKEGSTNIKVAYGNECKVVADSMDVSVRFSPMVIDLGADIVVCRDTALVLDAGAGFSSYRWQDGASTPTYSVSSPGVYSILAMNDCGQEYGDNFELIRNIPSPFFVSPANAVICQGDSVQFNASGGTFYSWQPAVKFDHPHSSSPKALVDVSETYMVLLSDAVCLRDTVISIPVTAAPAADIRITKTNDVSCSVDSAVLIASGGLSYTWSPDGFISRQAGNRITVKPPGSVTYSVTGINDLGCTGKDSVLVEFKDEGEQKLFVPNAFSPNGDGLNDQFRPVLYGYARKYEFRVFNRWGELVFQTIIPNKGWDGTYRNKIQPGDVYVYYLKADGICNDTFERKGTFVLIK